MAPTTNGEAHFEGSVTASTSIKLYRYNSSNVDYEEFYTMLDRRELSCTLTVNLGNDMDDYVIYEAEPQNITYDPTGDYLTIVPTTVYSSPLVNADSTIGDSSRICVQFDLFRGIKTIRETGVTGSNANFYQVPQANYDGMVIDYVARKTNGTTGTRTGTIMAAWNGTNASDVQFTDQSTRDVPVSLGIRFTVTVDGTNASVSVSAGGDTYNVTLNVRRLGAGG